MTKRTHILLHIALIGCLSLILASGVQAQSANKMLSRFKVQAYFDRDTTLTGMPLNFVVKVEHPQNTEFLFADSAASFYPFELNERKYFNTVTKGGISTDSVVYNLSTFELDSVQSLAIPVYWLNKGDSVEILSNIDSVILSLSIPKNSTAESLTADTSFNLVPRQFNYIYWSIGVVFLIVVVLVANFYLGQPIQKAVRLLLMYRNHQLFESNFDRLCRDLHRSPDAKTMEEIINLWKNHLQRISTVPYSSYTTKEFITIITDKRLHELLTNTDRWIYGGLVPERPDAYLDVLKGYTHDFYKQRRAEVRNG